MVDPSSGHEADSSSITSTKKRSVQLAGRKSIHQAPSRRITAGSRYSQVGHLIPTTTAGKLLYQPNYRLEPKRPLRLEFIHKIVKYMVDAAVEQHTAKEYSLTRGRRFCSNLARDIQTRIHAMHTDRYRLVVFATLVECANTSCVGKMGFVWDVTLDHYVHYTVENQSFVLTICVAFVYYE